MQKINLIQCLTRLSAIAEEIEEQSPEGAEMIDETISDFANHSGQKPTNIDKNLFPPITTPQMLDGEIDSEVRHLEQDSGEENADIQDLARTVTDRVINSPEYAKILPELESGKGEDKLGLIIDNIIRDLLKDQPQL